MSSTRGGVLDMLGEPWTHEGDAMGYPWSWVCHRLRGRRSDEEIAEYGEAGAVEQGDYVAPVLLALQDVLGAMHPVDLRVSLVHEQVVLASEPADYRKTRRRGDGWVWVRC